MKNMILLGASVATLFMSACVSSAPSTSSPTQPLPSPAAASTQADTTFTCRDGRIATVRYNAGEDKIRLYVDTIESSAILTLAPSGSGERYTNNNGFYNKPTELHMKGKQAALSFQDPYGNSVQTTCHSK